MADPKPSDTSSDYDAMRPYWDKVDTILGGTEAMRAAGTRYLPRFVNESTTDYDFRRDTAKFTNVFRDIVENLAAKPFAKEATVKEDSASDRVKKLVEDIDGQGNHLHVFAANMMFSGIANAIDWVLVDYTKDVPANATVETERKIGVRPFWVHIPAQRLLAAYSEMIGGVETFVHARIREDATERDGYGERMVERIRVLNRVTLLNDRGEVVGAEPATWELFENKKTADARDNWVSIGGGAITIGVIPLVPFITGRRVGSSWRIVPPMQDAADLQIELFQQESGLKYAKTQTAFPMLSASGVEPPIDENGKPMPVPVGPKTVLYAPPNSGKSAGEWKFIEPGATALRFLADDVKETIQQLRELGRQPLTARTGNLTVVTTAFAAQKGNSAVQAWALNLKDAIENALRYTVKWLKEDREPEFAISTDFDVGLNDDKGPDTLLTMRDKGDLSQETLWHEMKRRSILSPDFEADDERDRILEEVPGDDGEDGLDASLTPPLPDDGRAAA